MASKDFYTVEDLCRLRESDTKWVIQNMLPCVGRSIIYGEGGVYKSAILFDLAVAVASGGLLLEQFPIQTYGPVLLISTEGSVGANRDRLLGHMRSRNASPETVQIQFRQKRIRLDTKSGLKELGAKIKDLQPRLVILDPYVSFFSGDENRVQDVMAMLAGVDEIIDEYHTSVAFVHHANKAGLLRGSSALWGWTDAALEFKRQKNVTVPGVPKPVDIVSVVSRKQRNGPEGDLFTAVPLYSESLKMVTFGVFAGTNARGVVIAYTKQAVLTALRNSPVALTKAELVASLGVSFDKVTSAIDWLARDNLIARVLATRPTSNKVERTRPVEAWTASAIGTRVDAACSIIEAERQAEIDANADEG